MESIGSTLVTDRGRLRRVLTTLTDIRWPTILVAAIFSVVLLPGDSLPGFLALLAGIAVYSLVLSVAIRRVRDDRVEWVGYASVALDTVALCWAIGLTGGFYSPYHIAFYAIAISVSVYFGRNQSIAASLFAIGCYAIAVTVANGVDAWQAIWGEFLLRGMFLLLASIFVARLSADRQTLSASNTRLEEEIRQRARIEQTLRAMNEAATRAASDQPLGQILDHLTVDLVGLGYRLVVLTVSPQDGTLRLAHAAMPPDLAAALGPVDTPGHPRPVHARPGSRLASAIASRETTYFESSADFAADLAPAIRSTDELHAMALRLPGGAILSPLVVDDGFAGVVVVNHPELSARDAPTVDAFAHQLAAAMETAKLVRELRASLSSLRETQAQLIQSAKMASVGTLAAGVAHEINNPLMAITGRAQLLLDRQDQYLNGDRAVQYVTVIRDMARRLEEITRALLSFSRAGTGDMEQFSLADAVEETLNLVANQLRNSGIELKVDSIGTPAPVRANQNQVGQVLMNLILNARDAMPEGGTIQIRSRFDAPPGMVRLEVSDTGGGMAPEVASRVFDPFYTTKEVGKGTGLGLFVSRGIAERHGGGLEISQTGPSGTTLVLSLPTATTAPAGARDRLAVS